MSIRRSLTVLGAVIALFATAGNASAYTTYTYYSGSLCPGCGRNDAAGGFGLGYRHKGIITHFGGGWSNYVKTYDGAGAPDVTQLTTTGNPVTWLNPIPAYNAHMGCINQNMLTVHTICQFDN